MKAVGKGILVMAAALGSAACIALLNDERDIVVWNGSDCSLARLVLDGVDRGPIGWGEQRVFGDVGPGEHTLAAYRRADSKEPCDSHTTDYLSDDEDDVWTIHCDCDAHGATPGR